MSFNPFKEKPMNFDEVFIDQVNLAVAPYNKDEADAYTKIRTILMNGTEFEAVGFLNHFHRHCNNNELRRELALIRKSEQQQQKCIAGLKPINESILEHTIGYEQLAVDLTAALAIKEPDPYVKLALDFALLEDFDHLYRYANLLDMQKGIHAEKLVGCYTEIMPARPTISEARYPYDDVKRFTNFKTAAPITKLNIGIITAAEQQTMNYYMNQSNFYPDELGRKLYNEIALIEEQHVTHYGSLLDPNSTYLECLLMHEYTECYLYYSCYMDEKDVRIKKLYEKFLLQEITHLHKAAELLKRFERREWQEVIPDGELPELLTFSPKKEYVRKVIRDTVRLTARLEDYEDISRLPHDYEFFKYQDRINHDISAVPSHNVITEHINRFGKDYRYEENPNPIEELRNRQKDNVNLARTV